MYNLVFISDNKDLGMEDSYQRLYGSDTYGDNRDGTGGRGRQFRRAGKKKKEPYPEQAEDERGNRCSRKPRSRYSGRYLRKNKGYVRGMDFDTMS